MPIELSLEPGLNQLLFERPGAEIKRSVIPGGIRVITEKDANMRSVSLGFWLPVGSRDEIAEHAGSTHFLEHLLFKGTVKRSALEIAQAFDEVGGESNAITAKEHTCYFAKVRATDLVMATQVLADMVTSSKIDSAAFLTEREVILEELAMAEDDPTDIGHDRFAELVFNDHPLGRPVGGSKESISKLEVESVREHYKKHYLPQNLVVTAVGEVNHEEFCQLLSDALTQGGWELSADGDLAKPNERRSRRSLELLQPRATLEELKHGATARLERPSEQTHIFLGGQGINAWDNRRHAMNLMMSILGGGMSSRLFQEIREKRGLVYSVYGFSAGYADNGLFGMYAACRSQHTDKVSALMLEELVKLAEGGVELKELQRAKGQIAGSMALGLEDSAARMGRLASAEIMHAKFTSVDEALESFNQVSEAQITDLAFEMIENLSVRFEVGSA